MPLRVGALCALALLSVPAAAGAAPAAPFLGLAAAAPSPCLLLAPTADALSLSNGFVRLQFSLTRGSVDVVQGRFAGDGDFSGSPNLAGMQGAPAGTRRGAVAVVVSGLGGGGAWRDASTSSLDRASPLAFKVLANDSAAGNCGFSVDLGDSAGLLTATLRFALSGAAPRQITVGAAATAAAGFSPTVVSLSTLWTPPSATGLYVMPTAGAPLGVRQGMQQSAGFLASHQPLVRAYVIGNGSTGALEALPLALGAGNSTWLYGGKGGPFNTAGGIGVALFGAAPEGGWVSDFSKGDTVSVAAGDKSPAVELVLLPNDLAFPPSRVPAALPPGIVQDDLQAALQAAHGAVVAPLHSYDFSPEVRATPCLTINDGNCYGGCRNAAAAEGRLFGAINLARGAVATRSAISLASTLLRPSPSSPPLLFQAILSIITIQIVVFPTALCSTPSTTSSLSRCAASSRPISRWSARTTRTRTAASRASASITMLGRAVAGRSASAARTRTGKRTACSTIRSPEACKAARIFLRRSHLSATPARPATSRGSRRTCPSCAPWLTSSSRPTTLRWGCTMSRAASRSTSSFAPTSRPTLTPCL
jgi:hypothetical protein